MDIAYFSIGWMSTKDGPGNRVVVYMQGCPVRCPWCHSPHSQPETSPILLNRQFCSLCGRCADVCPNGVHIIECGRHYLIHDRCVHCGKCISSCPNSFKTFSDSALCLPTIRLDCSVLFETLYPQLEVVKKSGGITLSGGEALFQCDAAIELLKKCREHNINTCVETSMLLTEAVYQKAAEYVDCWLLGLRGVYLPDYSGPSDIELSCKRLIDIFRKPKETRLIARLPLIQGYTDKTDRLKLLKKILLDNALSELEILPCNPHMDFYYDLLGKEVEVCTKQCIPDNSDIRYATDYFRNAGILVTVVN